MEITDLERPIPPTVPSLTADLHALGVEPGMTLLVHSSLRAVAPWVIGGPTAVILALESVLTSAGTLVMPTHSADLSDPKDWVAPPIPEHWWETVRQQMPAFLPDLTVTYGMGAIPETFRKQDGVRRSDHPQTSFSAWGKHAHHITQGHRLESDMGEYSPLGRVYEVGGYVLLLGVGHECNTSLHLAEYKARWQSKRNKMMGAPILVDGERRWVEFPVLDTSDEDFPKIGADFGRETGLVRQGKIGNADSLLMPQRALVDFGIKWMEKNR